MRFSRRRLRKMSRPRRRPRKMKAPMTPPAIAPERLLCFERVDMPEDSIPEAVGVFEGATDEGEDGFGSVIGVATKEELGN